MLLFALILGMAGQIGTLGKANAGAGLTSVFAGIFSGSICGSAAGAMMISSCFSTGTHPKQIDDFHCTLLCQMRQCGLLTFCFQQGILGR